MNYPYHATTMMMMMMMTYHPLVQSLCVVVVWKILVVAQPSRVVQWS